MEERLILRPSRKRQLRSVLVLGGLAVVAGFLLAADPTSVKLRLAFALFALLAGVAGIQLMPDSAWLELTPAGFRVKSLYRVWGNAWSEVRDFGVGRIGRAAMVTFGYAPGYKKQEGARHVARALGGGFEAALPDTYGMEPEALAKLMNEWQAKHGGTS